MPSAGSSYYCSDFRGAPTNWECNLKRLSFENNVNCLNESAGTPPTHQVIKSTYFFDKRQEAKSIHGENEKDSTNANSQESRNENIVLNGPLIVPLDYFTKNTILNKKTIIEALPPTLEFKAHTKPELNANAKNVQVSSEYAWKKDQVKETNTPTGNQENVGTCTFLKSEYVDDANKTSLSPRKMSDGLHLRALTFDYESNGEPDIKTAKPFSRIGKAFLPVDLNSTSMHQQSYLNDLVSVRN